MRFQHFAIAAACLMAAALSVGAESLWTPGFQGYLSGTTTVRTGDILNVVIDTTSSLSFEASSNDAKSLTLEFSGGEFGNLFAFLPVGRAGGSRSVRGAQEYELSSEIAARVVESDASGNVRIVGSRGVSIQGREEVVSISGWLDPDSLGAARQVRFSGLADSTLRFTTFLQAPEPVLTEADIEEVVAALEAEAAPGAVPPRAPGPAPGGPAPAALAAPAAPPGGAAAAAGPTTTYALTTEKKTELFLRYVNRLVDILFQ